MPYKWFTKSSLILGSYHRWTRGCLACCNILPYVLAPNLSRFLPWVFYPLCGLPSSCSSCHCWLLMLTWLLLGLFHQTAVPACVWTCAGYDKKKCLDHSDRLPEGLRQPWTKLYVISTWMTGRACQFYTFLTFSNISKKTSFQFQEFCKTKKTHPSILNLKVGDLHKFGPEGGNTKNYKCVHNFFPMHFREKLSTLSQNKLFIWY